MAPAWPAAPRRPLLHNSTQSCEEKEMAAPKLARGASVVNDFMGAGEEEGLQVWRIENMKPIPVPDKMHGQFYEGDSYIVLKTSLIKNSLNHQLFFWLGSESTRDEQGVAAYKTVELDTKLGGVTQHREEQNFESDQFMQW